MSIQRTLTRRNGPRDVASERGVALVAAVLFLVAVVGLVGLSLGVASDRSRDASERDAFVRLRRVAESAMALKTQELSARDDRRAITVTAENVTVDVEVVVPAGGEGTLVLDALARTTLGHRLRLYGSLQEIVETAPLFNHAIFAAGELTTNGMIETKSYDGLVGIPSSATLGDEGHVGGNGQVSILGDGSVIDGLIYHTEGQLPILADGVTSQGLSGMPEAYVLPDLIGTAVTDAKASTFANPPVSVNGTDVVPGLNGAFELTAGESVVFGPGTYVLSDLVLREGVQATFSGDAKIVVGNVTLERNASLTIGGQNVELYYGSQMVVRDGAVISVTADAEGQALAQRFAAYGGTDSSFELRRAAATGVFYAPEGDASIADQSRLQGSLIGRNVDISGGDAPPPDGGTDVGLPGGHFDIDVWFRKADGKMDLARRDYHEHQYDDNKNTDSVVIKGSTPNRFTGQTQNQDPNTKWSNLIAAQGANTQVEIVLSHRHHASGTFRIETTDGTKQLVAARGEDRPTPVRLGDVSNLVVQLDSLYDLLGTEPSSVNKDPINRGTETELREGATPKKGAYGFEMYRVNPDGTRGQIIYEFRTYFHNNTGEPWPPFLVDEDPSDDTSPETEIPGATAARFDTSLRAFRPRMIGQRRWRIASMLEAPVGQSAAEALAGGN